MRTKVTVKMLYSGTSVDLSVEVCAILANVIAPSNSQVDPCLEYPTWHVHEDSDDAPRMPFVPEFFVQFKHCDMLVIPTLLEYVSAGQSKQTDAPSMSAYVPGLQLVHPEEMAMSEYFPASQRVHSFCAIAPSTIL